MKKWKKLKTKNPAGKGAGELTRQKKNHQREKQSRILLPLQTSTL